MDYSPSSFGWLQSLRSFFYQVARRLNVQRVLRDVTLPIKTNARNKASSVGGCAPSQCKNTSTGNPFADFSEDELILAYVNFSHMNDVEAIDLVFEVYDMYTCLDLTPFGISTRDFA